MITKPCTKCGESKPVEDFYKDSRRRSGLESHCKLCRRIAQSNWQKANPLEASARAAKWRAANPGKARAIVTKWRDANIVKARESEAGYHALHPNAKRIRNQNRRARKLEVGGKLSNGLVERLLTAQRGKCVCCKQRLGCDFHRDHIMPLALGGTNTDDNMQLLCQTCNLQKHAKHPIEFMQQKGYLL